MSERRATKKSETLEVRVEHEIKSALMQRAQAEGRSASDVIRECIDTYLAAQPKEARSMMFTWKAATAVGAAATASVWLAVAAAPAAAGPDLKAAFEALDRNRDGALTVDEFLSRSPDTLYVIKKEDVAPAPVGEKPLMIPLGRALPAPPPHRSQPPQEMLRSEFAKHDRDRNGSVKFSEFEAHHAAMFKASFAAVDKNGDGSLDPAEYQAVVAAGPGGSHAAAFSEIDSNRDGKITEGEFFS